jgi:hypothetical protein
MYFLNYHGDKYNDKRLGLYICTKIFAE